jgi:hypothetical protein
MVFCRQYVMNRWCNLWTGYPSSYEDRVLVSQFILSHSHLHVYVASWFSVGCNECLCVIVYIGTVMLSIIDYVWLILYNS